MPEYSHSTTHPPEKKKKALVQFAIALLVAVVTGGVAISMTYSLLSGMIQSNNAEKARLEAEMQKTKAELLAAKAGAKNAPQQIYEIHAAQTIPAGTPIEPTMVTQVSLDGDNALRNPDAFQTVSEVAGMVPSRTIQAGETITQDKLSIPGQILPVPEGMRAISIPIDAIGGVMGTIKQGSSVDVLTTASLKSGVVKTKTLLQNALVVGVGRSTPARGSDDVSAEEAKFLNKKADAPPVAVILATSPKDAEKLALASRFGRFHLTLRSPMDNHTNKLAGMDVSQLLEVHPSMFSERKPPDYFNLGDEADGPSSERPSDLVPNSDKPDVVMPSKPNPNEFTMQVIRGNTVETQTFILNDPKTKKGPAS